MSKKVLLSFILLILMFNFISALEFEFDNVKAYDPVNTEVTFKNSFLGIPTTEIAKVKLNTPLEYYVMPGEDRRVAEFTIDLYDNEYTNPLKQLQIYEKGREINREFTYKYLTYEDYLMDVPNYKEVCKDIIINNKTLEIGKVCSQEVDSYSKVTRQREKWINLDTSKLIKGKITIGIFTDVKVDDYKIDWIPTMFGNNRVDEWATWTSSLNVGLKAYWTMNETGTMIDSITGAYNVSGTPALATGIINNSRDFTAKTGTLATASATLQQGSFTFNAWVYRAGTQFGEIFSSSDKFLWGSYNNGKFAFYANGGSCTGWCQYSSSYPTSSWVMTTMVYNNNTGNITFYQNGAFAGSFIESTGWIKTNDIKIAGNTVVGYWPGNIDELSIWNRTLTASEVTDLYNGGVGLTYVPISLALSVTTALISPVNFYNTSATSVDFSANATAVSGNVTNMTLYLWGSTLRTNVTTGLSGLTNTTTRSLSGLTDYTYIWNFLSCATDSTNYTCSWGTNRTLIVDTTPPIITIYSPTGSLGLKTIPYNVTLNFTAIDSNTLDKCFYNSTFNSSITFISCTNESQILVTNSLIENTIYVYANDTFGNVNFSSTTFNIDKINSITYTTPVLEGISDIFTFNFSIGSGLRVSSTNLVYNGTSTTTAFIDDGNDNYRVILDKIIPQVDTDTNYTFYWSIRLEDGTTRNSSIFTQLVNNFSVDNCGTYTNLIYNFTLKDEDTLNTLAGGSDNTSIKVDLQFKNPNTNITILNYSNSYALTNPARVCTLLDLGNLTYRVDGVIEYSSNSRYKEFYNIQNYLLTNSSARQNINLYDLNNSIGTEFKITYKDTNFRLVPDAVIQIQRKYVAEGLFRVVELPKISTQGYAIAHLIKNDAIYNLIVLKDGIILGTFENIVPFCQNPTFTDCEININSYGSSIEPKDYSSTGDFISTLTWNKTSRVVTSTFSIPSGASHVVSLNATLFDALGNRSLGSDSLTSSGGTLSVTIPSAFQNSTLVVRIYSDGVEMRKAIAVFNPTAVDMFGNNLIFLAIVMFMFFIGIGISQDPKIMGVILAIGVVVLGILNLITIRSWIGAGATILWFIVCIVLILIKRGNKS